MIVFFFVGLGEGRWKQIKLILKWRWLARGVTAFLTE